MSVLKNYTLLIRVHKASQYFYPDSDEVVVKKSAKKLYTGSVFQDLLQEEHILDR